MTWVAVAVGGISVVGAGLSYAGSEKASERVAQGSEAAIGEQARQFDIIRGDTADTRAIGNQAINALGSIYGYQPASQYFQQQPLFGGGGGTQLSDPYGPQSFGDTKVGNFLQYDNFLRPVVNPAADIAAKFGVSPTSKLGIALDPLGFGLGQIFGSKHGDERRNLKAFTSEVPLRDLGSGMLQLPDGTIFPQSQLEELAGTWYGAKYAPDGDQAGWQRKYETVLSGIRGSPWNAGNSGSSGSANIGRAGTGLTSEGVPQGVSTGPTQQIAPDYSKFFMSPDYQFRRSEGLRDINNSFAARGGALSGNALRALTQYNSDLAAGEFGNYFNRQAALAGIGQTATGQSAQAGLTTGANIGNALINAGNARASGIAGQYNAIGQGLSGLGSALGYWNANRRIGG